MSPPASSDGIVLFAYPCSSPSLLALSLFHYTRAKQTHVNRAGEKLKSAGEHEDSSSYGTIMTICHHETGSDIAELRLPFAGRSCLFNVRPLLSANKVFVILGI